MADGIRSIQELKEFEDNLIFQMQELIANSYKRLEQSLTESFAALREEVRSKKTLLSEDESIFPSEDQMAEKDEISACISSVPMESNVSAEEDGKQKPVDDDIPEVKYSVPMEAVETADDFEEQITTGDEDCPTAYVEGGHCKYLTPILNKLRHGGNSQFSCTIPFAHWM